MSQHRQQNYKTRGRGGAFERLGLPVRNNNYQHHHQQQQPQGDFRDNFRGGPRGGGPNQRFQRGGRGIRGGGYNNQYQRGRAGFNRGGGAYRGGGGGGGEPSAASTGGVISEHQHFSRRQGDRQVKEWFKIVVTRGSDYQREALLKALSNYMDRPVWPVMYKITDDGNATFFVDDLDMADSISAASRRVSVPPSQVKLNIRMIPNASPPYTPLDAADEDLIRNALQHRYNPMDQSLNLRAFTFDDAFKEYRGSNLSLQRNNVMMSVVDLIGKEQAIADKIQTIDISENRLRFMDYFASFVARLPNVVRLILHHNQIDNLNELEKLSGWNLLDLDLDQTPLASRYNSKDSYVRDIRGIFKKLTRLDGVDLPPLAETKFGLDVTDEVEAALQTLPPFKPSFFLNDDVQTLVVKFLQLYFEIFDSEDKNNRQSLLEAYDMNSVLTISAMNLTHEAHQERGDNWNEITRDSHNILKMEMWHRFREKLIHKGKLAILAHLCNSFPATMHLADSFVVDISFASGNIMCLNVNGIFRERKAGVTDVDALTTRVFNRVFLLARNEGGGLRILNEMITISTLAASQLPSYKRLIERAAEGVQSHQAAAAATAGTSQAAMSVTPADPVSMAVGGEMTATTIKQEDLSARPQMIEQFARESGMKMEWAQRCLEEFDYNFTEATTTFARLRQQGSIPPEAFQ